MITLAKNIQYFVDIIVTKSSCHDKIELSRLNHYVWITLLMAPVALGTSAYNAYIHNFTLAFLVILFSTHLIGSLYLIPKMKETFLLYHTSNLLYAFLILYMIFNAADTDNSRILWAYVYPIGTIFLFGNRLGFLYSCLLLGMIIGLFGVVPEIHTAYSIPFQVRFSVTYMTVAFISSWVEYHRSRYQKESMRTHKALFLEQINLKEEIEQRIELEKELQYLAQTDTLTGLHNRRYFLEVAEQEFTRSVRYNGSICFAVLDVDQFKSINDTLGHPIGDAVLQALAKHCLKSLRETDIIARIGGEEFAFLLLHVNEEQAREKLETLRKELSLLDILYDDGKILNFTVSIGLAMCTPEIKRLDELYIKADAKLYEAKDAGRNCVR